MLLREDSEKREYKFLSEYAFKSAESAGRKVFEPEDEMRTCFQKDRDRIVHSKALRRLMHKTQVFIAPEGDHYRTRLTHTLEVAQIARTIARCLELNEDLTEAVAMGHDLGHTPFGHNGEKLLNVIHPGGFAHNIQSLRVVDVIEKTSNGNNLNLTAEVRDGIVNHSGPNKPLTLEGKVVRISDRIAYINHDIDDALRSGVIKHDDIPKSSLDLFGNTHGQRINSLVMDIINCSDGINDIKQSEEFEREMLFLREWLFSNVYRNPEVKKIEEMENAKELIYRMYEYYIKYPEHLPSEYYSLVDEWGRNEAAKDYISGMTDRYAQTVYNKIFNK